MNWKPWALGGAVIIGAGLFLRSFADGIKYEFKSIKWLGMNGTKLRFALIFDLINVNDINATVSKFQGKLKYGDHHLSDVVIGEDKAIELGPGATEPMEVRFSISVGGLLGELLQFIDEKSGIKKFHLAGWMSGKVGRVPFKVYFDEPLALT